MRGSKTNRVKDNRMIHVLTLQFQMLFQMLFLLVIATGCGINEVSTDGAVDIDDRVVANSVRIAAVTGDVTFLRTGESQDWIPAVSGMQLALSDTLTTQIASETDLDVDDDQHVLVGEQVRMVIETLLRSVNESQVARLRVDTGALYVRIQRKLKTGEAFEIITPTCVMGVRGTEFVVSSRGGDSQIFVMEGTVQVAVNPKNLMSLNGKSYSDSLPASSWISVEKGRMLEVPWGTESIDMIQPLPIDFNKMPLDMLKALLKSDSAEVLPYLPVIEAAEKDQRALQAAQVTAAAQLGHSYIDIPQASEKPYVDPLSGHVYSRVDLDMTVEQAIAYCNERGGHLITITSAQEQALANALMAKGSKFWYFIGLIQKPGSVEPKEGFAWVTGEEVTFTNWHKENGVETEPSDRSGLGNHENEVVMLNFAGDPNWKFGDWNDMTLTEKLGEYGFLCEWDSVNHFYGLDNAQDSGEDSQDNQDNQDNQNKSIDISAALTYEYFITIQTGVNLEEVQKVLGAGTPTKAIKSGVEETKWMFKDGNRNIIITTQENASGEQIVVRTFQRAILSEEEVKKFGKTVKDLGNVTVRGKLNQMKSLKEAADFLGSEGELVSRFIMEGEVDEVYQWQDGVGQGYQIILHTGSGILDISFF